MKALLASSLGGSVKVEGMRFPSKLIQENDLNENLKAIWPDHANVLFVCADPNDHERNDGILNCLRESFPMSGLTLSDVSMCDGRNPEAIERLDTTDVLILIGGHVPTQNAFLHALKLKQRLSSYKGIVIAWSAGSMNCADIVYAAPEEEGEAIDPAFERWISGLGITDINILPHFQSLQGVFLDGLRIVEDIAFKDSFHHEIIALNDGSYLLIEDKKTTLYGETYRIRNGAIELICKGGESVALQEKGENDGSYLDSQKLSG